MIAHDQALHILKRHVRDDDIVVAVYGTAVDWHALRPNPLNYFSVGAMGLAASHGLGLALGRPDKRVIVIDGDGSLTMGLGALTTVAGAAPKNFIHILWENGVYQANGGHPLPAQGIADYAGMALAAGYRSAHRFEFAANLEQQIGDILDEEGPVFVDLKIERKPFEKQDFKPLRKQALRDAFKAALNAER
jgi:thiamine pyrophosphate-dependent acetolactate synthase large subunit-like protein